MFFLKVSIFRESVLRFIDHKSSLGIGCCLPTFELEIKISIKNKNREIVFSNCVEGSECER